MDAMAFLGVVVMIGLLGIVISHSNDSGHFQGVNSIGGFVLVSFVIGWIALSAFFTFGMMSAGLSFPMGAATTFPLMLGIGVWIAKKISK